jgi:HAD superfamily hydrolase (TIGR01458 family)
VQQAEGAGLVDAVAFHQDALGTLGQRVAPERAFELVILGEAAQHDVERVALIMNDEVKEDFAQLDEVDEDAGAVIVGDLGSAFGYDVLNRAFRLVMDGAELVALQRNRYWRTPDGLSLDVGPFVAALEYASAREAHVVGKPAPAFFHMILQTARASAAQSAMVGDDVESDVGGAQQAGLAGILVRTGKYRENAVQASSIRPDATVDSVADVPALLGR